MKHLIIKRWNPGTRQYEEERVNANPSSFRILTMQFTHDLNLGIIQGQIDIVRFDGENLVINYTHQVDLP